MDTRPGSLPVIDLHYIVNVLIELQVANRKLAFYSFSHAIALSLLESLEKHFNALFEFVEEVTFGITRYEVLYQGRTLSSRNPVIRELARGLNQIGLAGMTFLKGLTKAEILKFLTFLVKGRAQSPERMEQMVSQLHQEVPSIRLKLIRFGEALKSPRGMVDASKGQTAEPEGEELWRGLVRQLVEEIQEEGQQILNSDSEEKADPAELAELINRLCQGNNRGSQSYERTIVRYLNKQSENQALTAEQRIHLNQELSKLLSNLKPDVKEQFFRISVEEAQKGEAPMKELLDFLPEPTLMEALNQVQLSNQNISAPMLGLLNKFTDLSVNSEKIQDMLASKLENHQDLFRELMTYRANREYYPSSYRSLLDQELTHQPISKEVSPTPEIGANNPAEVNYHLSLVILELLDGPISSQSEYEALIKQMNRLLTEDPGERTHAVLLETLILLFQKLDLSNQESRQFLQKGIRNFIKPEIFARLLQIYRVQRDERVDNIFGHMRELSRDEVIPILLDLLETEENLSVRKRLLVWIVQCGRSVIPLAVQRLKSPKWYVVRNMLVLLKDLHAKEALSEIAGCMQQDSPKLKLAALQAIEALGKGTDFFYLALSTALTAQDPGVFHKAVSIIISQRDPRAMEMINAQLKYPGRSKTDGHLMAVLEMIRKSGARELMPELVKLRSRLRLRFWQWKRTRALFRAVNETICELQVGEKE